MVRRRSQTPEEIAEKLLAGDRRAAARAISWVENQIEESKELMKRVYPHAGKSMVVGITGAGGSGKSTLIDHLIRKFRDEGKRVGVVAVDPSSPFSGGALLGDRIRFQNHALDDGVYIRSMGSRGYLGGLARATSDVVRVMEAMGNDLVIVETLGAGQDEVDIIHVAQTCLLLLTPGMGDDIQAMKAGIMEIADLIVLNKADLDGATTCLRTLEGILAFGFGGGEGKWKPRVMPTVSSAPRPEEIQGIDELVAAVHEHHAYLHESRAIEQAHFKRVEQELGLIFKDEVEKLVFKGLKGTGKRRDYIQAILDGKNDPYSVVDEVLRTFVKI
jgi:LAO/AO transport system kinase